MSFGFYKVICQNHLQLLSLEVTNTVLEFSHGHRLKVIETGYKNIIHVIQKNVMHVCHECCG